VQKKKSENKCYYCGGEQFETRTVKYIYSRGENHLPVPDMPAGVCLQCGMIYHHGPALLKVEARFKAIYQENAEPDRYTQMPIMDYVL
jgi:YgiT-type zinc finger domain-containing protein